MNELPNLGGRIRG